MKINKESYHISVIAPQDEAIAAQLIIQKLQKKLGFKYKISYNYIISDSGLYYYNKKNDKNVVQELIINPDLCYKIEEDSDFANGHTKDLSLFGIIIHEFSHMLSLFWFPIVKDYIHKFPNKRFYLNDYSNNCLHDEIAELVALYITNPYLLKLISKEHFNFIKKYFKSPIACSKAQCLRLYNLFPINCKEYLENRWGIIYNYETEKFESEIL